MQNSIPKLEENKSYICFMPTSPTKEQLDSITLTLKQTYHIPDLIILAGIQNQNVQMYELPEPNTTYDEF